MEVVDLGSIHNVGLSVVMIFSVQKLRPTLCILPSTSILLIMKNLLFFEDRIYFYEVVNFPC